MDYVLALGLLLLMGCALYYVCRLIIPSAKYVIGAVSLLAVSAGCLVFFLGIMYKSEVTYAYDGAWETLRALWDGFKYSLADLSTIFSAGKDTWALYLVLASLILNTIAGTVVGMTCCVAIENREDWAILSMIAAVFVVVGVWLALMVCELLLFMVIGMAEGIYKMVTDGTFGRAFGMFLFFAVLLVGSSPVVWIIVIVQGE